MKDWRDRAVWYVIQVMTGSEDTIALKLKEQGIRALVPKENRLIRSGGSWKRKEYILFSGYVFLDMSYNAENYYKVKNLPGVIKFLGDSRNPSKLSYLEAEWIMLLTGKDNVPIEPTVVKEDGDGNLKVVKGVLEKFENRVIKYDKRNRKATFEITICNEKKEVQLSIELDEDDEVLNGAGKDAAENVAMQVLKEAT
jgi:transcriptional antiterminator NusG